MGKFWLLKAEPDTRIVKGKDVKFSVDDFENVRTSPWEGVRNYEARNLMKEMKIGDKALFYHSNCKIPGIAGFAEVSKEAYPDSTAWDASHPYYDPKTDQNNPKWFMVDLTFTSRAQNFVPLALLRYIAESVSLAPEIEYIGEAGAMAIKSMDLVTRGRLSVQRVDQKAWDVIVLLAEKGGWEDMALKPNKGKKTVAPSGKISKEKVVKEKDKGRGKRKAEEYVDSTDNSDEGTEGEQKNRPTKKRSTRGKKRKVDEDTNEDYTPSRRSSRIKR